MSNTVITNFRDASGPRSSADKPFVVVLERDGTISLDNAALEGLVSGDGSEGISVVRVGQDGKPDDATDTESEDDNVPHVTLAVDGYFDDPSGIAKYDSGIEMLQSLSNETREHSLIGFQNDHCYTPLTDPSQALPSSSEISYDDLQIQSKSSLPSSKKITILEQQIIPKGKKIVLNPTKETVILKGSDVLKKPLPLKLNKKAQATNKKAVASSQEEGNTTEEQTESETESSEEANDHDSDADYKCRDELDTKSKKQKSLLRGMRRVPGNKHSPDKQLTKVTKPQKQNKSLIRQDIKDKIINKRSKVPGERSKPAILAKRKSVGPNQTKVDSVAGGALTTPIVDAKPSEPPKLQKIPKKDKKTPAHVTALLSDMTTLFSTPDMIRRVSTEGRIKGDKNTETTDISVKKIKQSVKTYSKNRRSISDVKDIESIPQIDDASLTRILQEPVSSMSDTSGIGVATATTTNPLASPNLGPLSPTLDLLGGIQPEEDGLSEDLLMHVAQLVENSENLKEVIDKEVLGKLEAPKQSVTTTPISSQIYGQAQKKDPMTIVRRDGRVIILPPIEAPTTRSKRKSQPEHSPPDIVHEQHVTVPELVPVQSPPKQYANKKLPLKKAEPPQPAPMSVVAPVQEAEYSQDSINSEDDPFRLWCICKQPHNNRFMICCDQCEDWFHGKCVNITKAMGQQMEEQGVEWTCPNCIKNMQPKAKSGAARKSSEAARVGTTSTRAPAPSCIVCTNPARQGSIYCSDACILRHAQESLPSQPQQRPEDRAESRVIVFERTTGRVLQGANAPTVTNLKAWLQEHPTFEVVRRERENRPLVNVKNTPAAKAPSPKVQTTLKFDKQQKQIILMQPQARPKGNPQGDKKVPESPQDASPKTPTSFYKTSPKPQQLKQTVLTNKDGKMSSRLSPMAKQAPPTSKLVSASLKSPEGRTPGKVARSKSTAEKFLKSPPATAPRTRREKEPEQKPKPTSTEPIRGIARKALQEHMTNRLAETKGVQFTEEDIKNFAIETELEMHNLFKDPAKYKAKYRSLIFNINDRKNLTLWEKICDRCLTPKQLVRMSPEELASQELAQWRDKEAKYQLELIKKSELDLLAANKTYVLKTHKGEEVMEEKSGTTELDPNVALEDLVTALNDSVAGEENSPKDEKLSKKEKESRRRSPQRSSSRHKSSRNKKKKEEDRVSRRSTKEEDRVTRRDTKEEDRVTRRETKEEDRVTRRDTKEEDRDSRRDNKEEDRGSRRDRHRSRERNKDKSDRSKSKERSRSKQRSRSRGRRRSRSKHNNRRSQSARRSRSQDNQNNKHIQSSKEAESVERPTSSLQKDVHPEYDPHEPMVTSAFSEEDLCRSAEETYVEDVEPVEEYDPSTLNFDSPPDPPAGSSRISERLPSEVESDQEPSSTVDSAAPPVWNGLVNMVDVARFYVDAHQVSGNCSDLEEDLSPELEIVGRINPETVWDYIGKTRRASNKDILVLRLTSSAGASVEERMQYIALYSYLGTRNRLGVVKVTNPSLKDFYIFPLAPTDQLPSVLLPLEGPGLEDGRSHLLFALIVRQRKKRPSTAKIDTLPAKVVRSSARKRSYTPPVSGDSYTPPASPARATRRSAALRLPLPPSAHAQLSSSVRDEIAASLASADDEPYSPGGSSPDTGPADSLRSRVHELDKQIEREKQKILSIASAAAPPLPAEDEAYSPSRPMTPPRTSLSNIALPSNLQEILANIQQRTQPPPPLPPPSVQPPLPPTPPPPSGTLHNMSEEELLRMVPDQSK